MTIRTRDFGEMEIAENDIIRFKQQIYGFDDYTNFVILYDDNIGDGFAWLQSTQEPALCFLMARPSAAIGEYCPELPAEAAALLGEGDYEYWLITVVPEDINNSTVNLKSPVVLNMSEHCAVQVILEENYPMRYRLFDKQEGA